MKKTAKRLKSAEHNVRNELISSLNPKSPMAEAFRTLRTSIHFSSMNNPLKTLLVTSTGPEEGKSTTLSNLAVVFAQAGSKVLVVDCDLRKPVQHKIFNTGNKYGLTSVLVNEISLMEAIKATVVEGLSLLTSGPIPPNPSELIGSQRMQAVLNEISSMFDYVFFDAPPTLAVTDAILLSALVDGVVFVVKSGVTKIELAKEATESIKMANGRIIGTVLNGVRRNQEDYHYYYYYGERK